MIRDIGSGGERAFTMLLRHSRWSPDGKVIVGSDAQAPRSHLADLELR